MRKIEENTEKNQRRNLCSRNAGFLNLLFDSPWIILPIFSKFLCNILVDWLEVPPMSADYSLMWLRHLKFSPNSSWDDLGLLQGCGCIFRAARQLLYLFTQCTEVPTTWFDSLDRTLPPMIPGLYRLHSDSEHLAADPLLPECELEHSHHPSIKFYGLL